MYEKINQCDTFFAMLALLNTNRKKDRKKYSYKRE